VSIGRAVRLAASDFYFNSWRFMPANLAWAASVLVASAAAVVWPPAIVLLVLTAVPLAGIHRMAALLARDEPAGFGDFIDGMRRFGVQAACIGAGAALLAGVLATNVVIGFGGDGPLGWFLGATALYGIAALAMYVVAAWPVLVDPMHDGATFRRRLQLAALLVVGRPGRLLLLSCLIVAVLAVSTVLLAAIVLVGVAYASLVATRWVLPATDELEARYEAARAR
jgi:uncharacterized membrane protein YesL